MIDQIKVYRCDHKRDYGDDSNCTATFIELLNPGNYIYSFHKNDHHQHIHGYKCIQCGAHMCLQHTRKFHLDFKREDGEHFEHANGPFCYACVKRLYKLFDSDILFKLAELLGKKDVESEEKVLDSDSEVGTLLEQLELT